MKKKILLCSFLALGLFSFAQEDEGSALQSKNGINILPEQGEWGLGANALPIFRHYRLGSTSSHFLNGDNVLFGKYFMSDSKTALRGRLRIADWNDVDRGYVVRSGSIDPENLATDVRTENTFVAELAAGIEYRRGKSRVQGYYGGEASVLYTSFTQNYDYANTMGGSVIAPETSDFSGGSFNSSDRRLTYSESGFGFGVNGFVGVEYFIAPKFSIGAEFSWGFTHVITGEGVETREVYTNDVEIQTNKTATSSSFRLDTGDRAGSVILMFYF